MVVFKNIFSDEPSITYFGEDCIEQFLLYMSGYNKGNNICAAHNGSGYDTRFIFEAATKFVGYKQELNPILRGTKFLQLKVGKTKFIDTLLHCPGSLKNLGRDFCPGEEEKGFFPYLFNSTENYSYGSAPGQPAAIPAKKFFGRCRTAQEFAAFNDWHDSWHAENGDRWDFMAELEKYCVNDVKILSMVMRKYHEIIMESTGMSPWLNTTAPSFVHEVIGVALTRDLELPEDPNTDEYKRKYEAALIDSWVALKPSEYWFARRTLMGGRTDVKHLKCELSPADIEAGCRIVYQDITSQYPYQQIVHDFPVGTPTIQVWDSKYLPCITHSNHRVPGCGCRGANMPRELCIERKISLPTSLELFAQDFFGIACVTLIPPKNLLFPVLVFFDEERKKSLSTLRDEDHREIFCTSIELQRAMQLGYLLVKIHRFDKYKRRPSLWHDKMGAFYVEKMLNSGPAPATPEARQELRDTYEERFGMGALIDSSWDRWGKHKAQKTVAKIMINSMWGKHAQRPFMTEAKVLNHQTGKDTVTDFFANVMNGNFTGMDSTVVGENDVMYRYTANGANMNPNLHDGYLPAAIFVTAWARLQLHGELHKLGKRALYHDTDSIIYVYDPREYNIPFGDILGEWSEEDISIPAEHGGIKKFIAMGPKTYGVLCHDGEESIKAKGISLGLTTSKQVNFASMEKLVDTFMGGGDNTSLQVEQSTFLYDFQRGMRTWNMLKDLRINPNEFKGKYRDGYIYPFGFIE